ncbi:MAG: sugar phosphate isomerase/epimerase [Anaerolineae bacterium]|nr:sugar phosphate isomerase/epimerase [Anaerolineae bacterium]
MFVLSGFGDEISPDLGVQLDVLEKLGIRYLELREVWNKGVLDLDDDEVATIKRELTERGMGVSAIGSPIGKIKIDEPMEPHLRAFDRAVYLAEFFGSPYIRMFSFYVPEGEADRYRSQVMERLRALLDHVQGHDVVLLHENESRIYGDIPRRCLDILETMASPQLRMTFDPANFVMNGIHPFTDAYGLLADHIAYLHIKDGLMAEKRVVPAGEGDGQVSEVLAALSARGFGREGRDMFVSLEPHLRHAGPFRGFSGPDLFQTAAQALWRLLQDVGAQEGR